MVFISQRTIDQMRAIEELNREEDERRQRTKEIEKLQWLINYWRMSAERSDALARTVSGEGEAAAIRRDTVAALTKLLALFSE